MAEQPNRIVAEQDTKIGHAIWRKGTTIYRCPKCNRFISYLDNYCSGCGCALDWREQEV